LHAVVLSRRPERGPFSFPREGAVTQLRPFVRRSGEVALADAGKTALVADRKLLDRNLQCPIQPL
jgi:hypothetical protein